MHEILEMHPYRREQSTSFEYKTTFVRKFAKLEIQHEYVGQENF